MKTHLFILWIVSLLLAGCAPAGTPEVPTPIPPVSTPVQVLPTSTTLADLPFTETATLAPAPVEEILPPTETAQPTATSAGLTVVIVGDTGQNPVQVPVQDPAPQAQTCQRPPNWVTYRVQVGDTLSSLGQRTNTGWQQLQSVNCLSSATIFVGQTLYVPFIPAPNTSSITTPGFPSPTVPQVTFTFTDTVEKPPAPGPSDPTVAVLPPSGIPTTKFWIVITDFEENEPITIRVFYAATLAIVYQKSTVVNGEGYLMDYFPSPADAAPGTYSVDVSGVNSAATGSFTIIEKQTP